MGGVPCSRPERGARPRLSSASTRWPGPRGRRCTTCSGFGRSGLGRAPGTFGRLPARRPPTRDRLAGPERKTADTAGRLRRQGIVMGRVGFGDPGWWVLLSNMVGVNEGRHRSPAARMARALTAQRDGGDSLKPCGGGRTAPRRRAHRPGPAAARLRRDGSRLRAGCAIANGRQHVAPRGLPREPRRALQLTAENWHGPTCRGRSSASVADGRGAPQPRPVAARAWQTSSSNGRGRNSHRRGPGEKQGHGEHPKVRREGPLTKWRSHGQLPSASSKTPRHKPQPASSWAMDPLDAAVEARVAWLAGLGPDRPRRPFSRATTPSTRTATFIYGSGRGGVHGSPKGDITFARGAGLGFFQRTARAPATLAREAPSSPKDTGSASRSRRGQGGSSGLRGRGAGRGHSEPAPRASTRGTTRRTARLARAGVGTRGALRRNPRPRKMLRPDGGARALTCRVVRHRPRRGLPPR